MFIIDSETGGDSGMSTGSFPGLSELVIPTVGARPAAVRTVDEGGGGEGGGTTEPPPVTPPTIPPGTLPPGTGTRPPAPVPGQPPVAPPVSPRPPSTGTQEPRTRPTGTQPALPPVGPPPPARPPGGGTTYPSGALPPGTGSRPPGPVPGVPGPLPPTGTRPGSTGSDIPRTRPTGSGPYPPVGPPPPPRPSGSERPPTTGTVGGGTTGTTGGGGGTGSAGGGGSTGGGPSGPPTGGGDGRTGGSGGGVVYTPHSFGAGDLGIPGGSAGSFRNIQQFLATNAPAEAAYAQKNFIQPLANKVAETITKEGNIPTQTQYDAARYPAQVPGVGSKPTQLGAVTIPDLIPEPGFLAGPQAWKEHAESEIARNNAIQRQKDQDAQYAKDLDAWEKQALSASAANKALIEGQKLGPQPAETGKASELGYQLGSAASPLGYNAFLANQGVGSGARKLDAYLYGATPGGAQQDARDLQQSFGGLLGLVKNWTPFGAKIDPKTGLAASGSVGGGGGGGTAGSGSGGTAGSGSGWVPETGSDGSKQPHPDWIFNDETGRWMSPAAYQAWLNIQRKTGNDERNRDVTNPVLLEEPAPSVDPGYVDPGTLLPPLPPSLPFDPNYWGGAPGKGAAGPSPVDPGYIDPGTLLPPMPPMTDPGEIDLGGFTRPPMVALDPTTGTPVVDQNTLDYQTLYDQLTGGQSGLVYNDEVGDYVSPEEAIRLYMAYGPGQGMTLTGQPAPVPKPPSTTNVNYPLVSSMVTQPSSMSQMLAQQNAAKTASRAARKDPANWDEDGYYIGP